jgi:hypothetical protein
MVSRFVTAASDGEMRHVKTQETADGKQQYSNYTQVLYAAAVCQEEREDS